MTSPELTAPTTGPVAPSPTAGGGRGRGLVADSLLLVAAGGITGLLGLAFWAATARSYPTAEVGRASAIISSAVVLCSLANLSLGSMFERFLPLAGRRASGLLVRAHLLTASLALLLGVAFLLLGPREQLFPSTTEAFAFPLLVAALAAFALQDQVVVGLGRARWAALKNTAHSVAKLVAVVALAVTASGAAVVAAWGVSAAGAALVVAIAVRHRLRSRTDARDAARLPARRELVAYFGASYGINTVAQVAPLAVPLVVVARLGTEENAYFALTWSLVWALAMLLYVVVGPFVTAASSTPERLALLTGRFVRVVVVLGAGCGLFLAFIAPHVLGVIGADYREAGTPLLRLMAVAMPLSVVSSLYVGLARVHRRLRLAVIVQAAAAGVVVAGSWLLSAPLGLGGVGMAYLAAEVLTAACFAVPLARWMRELRRTGA